MTLVSTTISIDLFANLGCDVSHLFFGHPSLLKGSTSKENELSPGGPVNARFALFGSSVGPLLRFLGSGQ